MHKIAFLQVYRSNYGLFVFLISEEALIKASALYIVW